MAGRAPRVRDVFVLLSAYAAVLVLVWALVLARLVEGGAVG